MAQSYRGGLLPIFFLRRRQLAASFTTQKPRAVYKGPTRVSLVIPDNLLIKWPIQRQFFFRLSDHKLSYLEHIPNEAMKHARQRCQRRLRGQSQHSFEEPQTLIQPSPRSRLTLGRVHFLLQPLICR